MAYTDPFSPVLGGARYAAQPLRTPWRDLGFDFGQTRYPNAGCAIGNADWVIIPRMIQDRAAARKRCP